MKEPKIVKVWWIDACGHNGWDEYNPEYHGIGSNCISVGYLVDKNKHGVVVSQGFCEQGLPYKSLHFIPLGMIKKIKYLK